MLVLKAVVVVIGNMLVLKAHLVIGNMLVYLGLYNK